MTAVAAIRAGDGRLDEGDVLERLGEFGERLEVSDLSAQLAWVKESCRSFKLALAIAVAEQELEDPVTEVEQPINLVQASQEEGAVNPEAFRRQLTRIEFTRTKKYLIIYSQGRKFARLHCTVSKCPWVHTLVKDCEERDSVVPSNYNARCKICFPNVETDS